MIPGSLFCSWISFVLVSVAGAVRTPQVLPSGDPGHVPWTYHVCSGAHSCPQPGASTPCTRTTVAKVSSWGIPDRVSPCCLTRRPLALASGPLDCGRSAACRAVPAGHVKTEPHPCPLSSHGGGGAKIPIFLNSSHRIPPHGPAPQPYPLLGQCLRLPKSPDAWKPALPGPSPAHASLCPGCLRDGLVPQAETMTMASIQGLPQASP